MAQTMPRSYARWLEAGAGDRTISDPYQMLGLER